MVGLGLWFRRRQTSTTEFFLGNRRVPGWAAALSFVATEVSAVTIISVPATAYLENWEYLQFFIGSAAARVVIAYLFIPAFYRFHCTTIYQFLAARFGVPDAGGGVLLFLCDAPAGLGGASHGGVFGALRALGRRHPVGDRRFHRGGCSLHGRRGHAGRGLDQRVAGAGVHRRGAAAVFYIAGRVDGGAAGLLRVATEGGRLAVFDPGPAAGAPGFWARFGKTRTSGGWRC
jgi:hypothetical protein